MTTIRAAMDALLDYRKRNTLNFQLEKMDDYLSALMQAIDDDEKQHPDTSSTSLPGAQVVSASGYRVTQEERE